MPPVDARAQGKGNHTVIENMKEIGAAIKMDPRYVTRWMSCELGCTATYDAKTGKTTVRTRQTNNVLQNLIWAFNDRFLKCAGCGYPELCLKVINGMLLRRCNACSFAPPTVSHKVVAYIIAHHPPPANMLKIYQSGGRGCKMVECVDDDWSCDTSSVTCHGIHKTENKTQKRKSDNNSSNGDGDDDGDDDANDSGVAVTPESLVRKVWDDALSKAAAAAAEEKLTLATGMATPSVTGDVENATCSKSQQNKQMTVDVASAVSAELKRASIARSLDAVQQLTVMWNVICAPPRIAVALPEKKLPNDATHGCAAILKAIKTNLALIQACVLNTSVPSLLSALEYWICTHPMAANLLQKVGTILQLLYDGNVITEAQLFAWFTGIPTFRDDAKAWLPTLEHTVSVKKAAEPFLHWLEAAEEEED